MEPQLHSLYSLAPLALGNARRATTPLHTCIAYSDNNYDEQERNFMMTFFYIYFFFFSRLKT